jgi:putative ABC transport system permease protein
MERRMLQLKNIVKDYVSGDTTVQALKGIDITFRDSEFVSILGQSGCGKTTLLNIIGGLDQYTSGDLIINGRSTTKYKDSDWDTYRNHTIGFVFQSYNLIPHQSVLSNVELALTLSGVSKAERRKRAVEVLEKVGLGDQIHKKPNQMSGGQMQRVAIARALVNNPDILLADEPTGALDSATSIQIMELLKEISKDRLIIMVTHNPELAEKYSSRIVRLLDGKVTDDTMPYEPTDSRVTENNKAKRVKKKKGTSMSFLTALSLSANNLMTKKGRTLLTAFAGSIGIIGIALILALSSGFQSYIKKVEEDTLSSYPIAIEEEQVDYSSMMSAFMGQHVGEASEKEDGKIYSNNIISEMLNSMMSQVKVNNLADFKKFIEDRDNGFDELVSDIQYGYSTTLNIYKEDTSDGIVQVNPSTVLDTIGMGQLSGMSGSSMMNSSMMGGGSWDVWSELIGNQTLLESQYDVIAGRWPDAYNEIVLIVDENNEISDYALYALGLKDQNEVADTMTRLAKGEEVVSYKTEYTYEDILDLRYRLIVNTDFYSYNEENDSYTDVRDDEDSYRAAIADGIQLQVVGILRPDPDAVTGAVSGSVGYTSALMEYVINKINASDIVKKQAAAPETDVITGLPFTKDGEEVEMENTFDITTLTPEQQAYLASLSQEELDTLMASYMQPATSSATYDGNMEAFGVADLEKPSSIMIYPVDFASKDMISDKISEYNDAVRAEGREEAVINYTDYIGLMMSSISTIINAISYVLIAFVAISLVVSSIMIGIITYISVLERTKEIGILRSIGASKHDISMVFNAETLIVGFVSGAMGIIVTMLLIIPINAIIKNLSGISNVAGLPWLAALVLVLISMALTFIAGLIPAKMAAKKDPVVALRSE